MIKLTINKDVFISEIQQRIDAAKELVAPTVLQEIAKASFTILGERFVTAVDREAVRNPKKLHHVYEWGKLGSPSGRLFVIRRSGILGGTLVMSTSFTASRAPVPIPPELQNPGATGKSVTARSIFKNKAEVMEAGNPVSFEAKRIITFLGTEGQVFVKPGTRITIMNPGGMQTKNAFRDFMVSWYTEHSAIIMDASGYYEKVASEAAAVITAGGGISAVRQAVARITNSIEGNKEVIK